MESWPADAADDILASAMRAMTPFGFAQLYPDGMDLKPPEAPFHGIFQIETGTAELACVVNPDEEHNEEVFVASRKSRLGQKIKQRSQNLSCQLV